MFTLFILLELLFFCVANFDFFTFLMCFKVHIDTPQILVKDTLKKFVISWRDGVIEVFRDNSKLFEWKDSTPFSISHYGVRTCWGAVGNWRIHGAADDQFKSQIVSAPKPKKPLKGKG